LMLIFLQILDVPIQNMVPGPFQSTQLTVHL